LEAWPHERPEAQWEIEMKRSKDASKMGSASIQYVAFLRGMNLGNRRLEMSRLRELFEALGYDDVATFIASGNVIFSTSERDVKKLESRIAKHLEKSLGYRVDTFVRTLDEVEAIARSTPFPEDGGEGITIHVGFVHDELGADVTRGLLAARSSVDEFRVEDREYYWLCRIRTPDSKVWASREVKALSLPTSTMRNMSSIRKLVAKHTGSDKKSE
jgi:uncharacterized protein (DUF1697 family)